MTTEGSLTTYDSSLASAHPAYTPGSFTAVYTHTHLSECEGRGAGLWEALRFSLLFHVAAAARLPDRKTALVHPPSPYHLFYLCSPSVLTHPPTDSCPLYRQVTPTRAVFVHVSDKNHEIAGVAPF